MFRLLALELTGLTHWHLRNVCCKTRGCRIVAIHRLKQKLKRETKACFVTVGPDLPSNKQPPVGKATNDSRGKLQI